MATFSNISPIAMNTTSDGKANGYPAVMSVTGLLGEVTNVSVKLNVMQQTDSHDVEEDIDILPYHQWRGSEINVGRGQRD
jgi:hypothetical protein